MANVFSRVIETIYELKDRFTARVSNITSSLRGVQSASDTATNKIESNNKRLEGSFLAVQSIVKRLIGIFAGLAVGNQIFQATRESEKLKASLETVTGSADGAKKAFSEINDFAATTPFQIGEIVEAFIKLKALGLDPSREALESYGNTASAMGKSLDQFIEAVADAATGEFERLKEFGIKASSQGEQVTFTFQGISTTVQKTAADIESYLRDIGNTQFAGAMDRQAKTLDGAVSNMEDSATRLLTKIGDTGSAAVKSLVRNITKWFEEAEKGIESSSDNIKLSVETIAGIINVSAHLIRVSWNIVQTVFRTTAAAIVSTIGSISDALGLLTFGEASKRFHAFASDMRGTAREILDNVKGDWDDIQNSTENLLTAFEETEKKANKSANGIEDLGNKATATADKTRNLKDEQESLEKAFDKAADSAQKEIKEFEEVSKNAAETRQKFEDLKNEMMRSSDEAKNFTFTDVVMQMTRARQALSEGDFSGAITGAEKAGEMLRKMKENGEESDGVLTGLALKLQEIVRTATEGQQQKELIDAQKSISEAEKIKAKLEEITQQPVELDLAVNTAQLDALRNIEPVVIPVRYQVVGTVPTFSDGTTDLRNESDKRGYRP